ncbi:fluoride efflux transporter CrcB [Photobacterium phosphoreum]|uniref:fluoride efflux transporter CrcB n=1 Tax=Photobacterium phosphoreum TaxID=659 RepID=UPI0024B8DE60|nr:fluoride efflux transporter CrcB [Photobacterium phosphoreum]
MNEVVSNLTVMWVGIGGGIGAILRYKLGNIINSKCQMDFPLSTFIINITGAFIIAYLSVLLSVEWTDRYGSIYASLILTGVLGGYTTFSSMQLDALKLYESGKKFLSLFYLFITVSSGFFGAALGVGLASL